jgi:hypothetical protein
MGSARAARQAGSMQAATETSAITANAQPRATGSRGLTLYLPEETEIDVEGDKPVPQQGETLLRPDGKRCKVQAVTARHDGGNALPVHLV